MQQKDIIYIDVEDDITAIIGKVKSAKEKIVALVPPKRTGVLQSAVNLRLLARAADGADKKLVLITGNAALSGLAASAKIPVAKNLQSKPELAEIPALKVDEDDVIDGGQLPVGEHAKQAEEIPVSGMVPPSTIDNLDIDGEAAPTKPKSERAKSSIKNRIKVPDFGTFRKKMFLAIGGGILLIAFLIWAIWFAPHATVVISAKTSDVDVKTPVTIGEGLQTDSTKATLASITQQEKVTKEQDIDATGSKEVGEKAKGTVVFHNCQDSSSLTVSAGTYISSGNQNYVVQSTVVVPGGSGNFITGCTAPGASGPVSVVATDIGEAYNTGGGAEFAVAGFSSKMTASSSAGLTGGSKRTIKVLTTTDVQQARERLAEQNTDDTKKKLKTKFDSGVKVIDSSFVANSGEPKLVPGIGEEASNGKAKMTTEITYTMAGIAQAVLDDYLKTAINEQLKGEEGQRIYDSGAGSVKLTEFKQATDQKTATVELAAVGQIGPKIDDGKIKDQVKGKRSGEIIGDLKAIEGVSDVEVKLSPFWVAGVPDDIKKITVEFKLIKND